MEIRSNRFEIRNSDKCVKGFVEFFGRVATDHTIGGSQSEANTWTRSVRMPDKKADNRQTLSEGSFESSPYAIEAVSGANRTN